MSIPEVPVPTTPYMSDKVVVEIQQYLKTKLSWLNHSFGRAQRLVTKKDKKEYFYPGVYIGTREYLNVLPTETFGNFSFFQIDSPSDINWNPHHRNRIKVKFSIIFWYNLSKIYVGETDRNTERIKGEILRVLTDMTLVSGSVSFSRIYEKAEDIYKEYSIKEVESQYIMQPFAGLRIEGEMTYLESC